MATAATAPGWLVLMALVLLFGGLAALALVGAIGEEDQREERERRCPCPDPTCDGSAYDAAGRPRK